MERTDNAGMRHTMDNAGYTLMKSESGYRDNQNFINAEFHRVGDDYTGAVAGRLDDASIHLMGAYGAIRDGIVTPPPPMQLVEGDPIGN